MSTSLSFAEARDDEAAEVLTED